MSQSLLKLPRDYWVLDFETNSLDHNEGDIIEIGLLKVENSKVVKTYNELANPGHPLSAKIVEITNITDEMLLGKRTPLEVMKDHLDIINKDRAFIVGHNLVRFDLLFANKYNNLLGLEPIPKNRCIDTAALFKELRTRHVKNDSNYDLPSKLEHLGQWSDASLANYTYHTDKVKFNLGVAVGYLGVSRFGLGFAGAQHRATYDCYLTHGVLEKLREEMLL